MIKNILIFAFLLSPALLSGQNTVINQMDSNGEKTGKWIVNDEQGKLRYEGNFVNGHPVDSLFRYYPDGNLKALMIYDSTGTEVEARIFDSEGRLRAEGRYMNQLKEGLWIFYGTKNEKNIEVNYRNDKLEGLATRYYTNGQPMEQTSWKNNELDGRQLVFDEFGNKTTEYYYRKGQMSGGYFVYSSNGKIYAKGTYVNNLKHGEWTYYKPSGEIDYTVNYNYGEPTNTEILDQRQKREFELYDKNRSFIKDPLMYLSDPTEYFRK